jgi:DNA-binding transcriptional MocR family regulator
MTDQQADTERVSVRAYLPRYQLDEWDDHADELDMSRSEYVKAMVQAGRRGFLDSERTAPTGPGTGTGDEPTGIDPDTTLETEVVDALATEGYLSWDQLLAAVTDDIEDRLEQTLQDLQAEDRVRYSGRNGGYTLDE